MANIDRSLELVSYGAVDILPKDNLKKLLQENRPLTIKAGFDPTSADLHLGHIVLLNKLKTFQDLGHNIVFIVGDYTAMIGDPSGKTATRPILSNDEITKFAQTYQEQAAKVLDIKKTKTLFNSSWLNKLSAADLIQLASSQTVARMLEREDFNNRFKQNRSIAIHEFLYPLIQGYDSVAIKADIEIGGTDQTFNLLMGREMQKNHNMKEQVVITMPIIEGLDGVKKMSKSLNNSIGVNDTPTECFGKIMSINDDIMWKYLKHISTIEPEQIHAWEKEVSDGKNPKEVKIALAYNCVANLHGEQAAIDAQNDFNQRFSKGLLPETIPEITMEYNDNLQLSQVMKNANMVNSTSEALRLIKQNAVKINQEKVNTNIILTESDSGCLIQAGKRRIIKLILQCN